MTEVNQAKLAKRRANQLNIWRAFLQNHSMQFLAVGQLIQILRGDITIYRYFQKKEQNAPKIFRETVSTCCFENSLQETSLYENEVK